MLITLLALACTGGPKEEDPPAGFTKDFVWGASIAGFQVEAGCPTVPAEECEDRNSDWYQWVTDPELIAESGTYLSGEPLSNAPGHYELYEEDFGLANNLGLKSLRTSIEWSRLFPDGSAEQATTVEELATYADPVALAHYHAYFDALEAAGLKPLVTLDHYTLPLWLHDGKACHDDLEACTNKGWMDIDRLKPAIALYSAFCAKEFGDQIDLWATLNEPLAVVLSGYLLPSPDRTNPPGVVNPDAAIQVLYAQAEGHIAMYDAVKAYDLVDADGDGSASEVGVVDNLVALAPLDATSSLDQEGVEAANYVYNLAFLNAAIRGDFDRDLDGVVEEQHPEWAGKMDYLGINYYTRLTIRGLAVPLFPDFARMTFYPEVLFEDYPEGLYEVAVLGSQYNLPMYITESGKAEPDETTEDTWLRPHLKALLRAREEGYDVRGFYYWSLLDNYEWNHGMGMHFGLHAVDLTSKERSLRPLGEAYRDIVSSGVP